MDGIVIRRPRREELKAIYDFFETVLIHTFKVNEVDNLGDLLQEEIEEKKRCINEDFKTNGSDRFFLVAEYKGEIIGSIEYGLSNELLNSCTNNVMKGLLEIGTVFVHPNHQRKGISAMLLLQLFKALSEKAVEEVCLDSGYKIAQKIWCKRFGDPEFFLKDFWGEGLHHMVWRVDVKEVLSSFNTLET